MQVMDIKPAPKTNLEDFEHWKNHLKSILISNSPFSKKINVSYGRTRYLTEAESKEKTKDWPKHDPDPTHCSGKGQKYCLEQGEHSWFNHSQDNMSSIGNLPPGFIEP